VGIKVQSDRHSYGITLFRVRNTFEQRNTFSALSFASLGSRVCRDKWFCLPAPFSGFTSSQSSLQANKLIAGNTPLFLSASFLRLQNSATPSSARQNEPTLRICRLSSAIAFRLELE
jgi:hypothetical protein